MPPTVAWRKPLVGLGVATVTKKRATRRRRASRKRKASRRGRACARRSINPFDK